MIHNPLLNLWSFSIRRKERRLIHKVLSQTEGVCEGFFQDLFGEGELNRDRKIIRKEFLRWLLKKDNCHPKKMEYLQLLLCWLFNRELFTTGVMYVTLEYHRRCALTVHWDKEDHSYAILISDDASDDDRKFFAGLRFNLDGLLSEIQELPSWMSNIDEIVVSHYSVKRGDYCHQLLKNMMNVPAFQT